MRYYARIGPERFKDMPEHPQAAALNAARGDAVAIADAQPCDLDAVRTLFRE
jgi:hypothetical protein